MSINPTKRNVLVAAALLGLVTSLLIYWYLVNYKTKENSVTMRVVVAAQDIMPRTIINDTMLEVRNMSQSEVPAGAFTNIDDVKGKVALVQLNRGLPIKSDSVDIKSVMLGLSYTIPQCMRAATVGINQVTGVAGFPKPGDHVDVVATFDRQNSTVTKMVLQNVELLALGSSLQDDKMSKDGKKPEISGRDTATLLVTPNQAEQLVLAEDKGKLRLLLRAPGDQTISYSSGAKMSKETASVRIQPAARQSNSGYLPKPIYWRSNSPVVLPGRVKIEPLKTNTEPQKDEKQTSIEVIRGTDVQQVKINEEY